MTNEGTRGIKFYKGNYSGYYYITCSSGCYNLGGRRAANIDNHSVTLVDKNEIPLTLLKPLPTDDKNLVKLLEDINEVYSVSVNSVGVLLECENDIKFFPMKNIIGVHGYIDEDYNYISIYTDNGESTSHVIQDLSVVKDIFNYNCNKLKI